MLTRGIWFLEGQVAILYSVTDGAGVAQDRVGKLGHWYESWPPEAEAAHGRSQVVQ